jgi:hypothetical protein
LQTLNNWGVGLANQAAGIIWNQGSRSFFSSNRLIAPGKDKTPYRKLAAPSKYLGRMNSFASNANHCGSAPNRRWATSILAMTDTNRLSFDLCPLFRSD